MLVIIDNYDSFTFNIVQAFGMLNCRMSVHRNDEITVEEIEAMAPSALVISPGPGRPEDAGISCPAIKHFAGAVPILGVCLGHQAIGHVYVTKIHRKFHVFDHASACEDHLTVESSGGIEYLL